ncbi:hypothetical protein KV557_40845 [Kitasatospora aureofaciens]|uniref:hypothetical protein n=1 Tax=Kitasatospora aureofaciens TaxID=1894 RepID=UPI001C47759C|nr:hypothetical protein [Kitasatospora aureofaciens]MBV6703358.1 hypothetical protein [Kitasatospora aureofaciens]
MSAEEPAALHHAAYTRQAAADWVRQQAARQEHRLHRRLLDITADQIEQAGL